MKLLGKVLVGVKVQRCPRMVGSLVSSEVDTGNLAPDFNTTGIVNDELVSPFQKWCVRQSATSSVEVGVEEDVGEYPMIPLAFRNAVREEWYRTRGRILTRSDTTATRWYTPVMPDQSVQAVKREARSEESAIPPVAPEDWV